MEEEDDDDDEDVEDVEDDVEDPAPFVLLFGGEFKRLAIILFKVVLEVINDEGFETKLLKVELEAEAEDEDEDVVEDDVKLDTELVAAAFVVLFVLSAFDEELC